LLFHKKKVEWMPTLRDGVPMDDDDDDNNNNVPQTSEAGR